MSPPVVKQKLPLFLNRHYPAVLFGNMPRHGVTFTNNRQDRMGAVDCLRKGLFNSYIRISYNSCSIHVCGMTELPSSLLLPSPRLSFPSWEKVSIWLPHLLQRSTGQYILALLRSLAQNVTLGIPCPIQKFETSRK